MTNSWRCECGRTNTIEGHFCGKCGREIPQDIVDDIIREETQSFYRGIMAWVKAFFLLIKDSIQLLGKKS